MSRVTMVSARRLDQGVDVLLRDVQLAVLAPNLSREPRSTPAARVGSLGRLPRPSEINPHAKKGEDPTWRTILGKSRGGEMCSLAEWMAKKKKKKKKKKTNFIIRH